MANTGMEIKNNNNNLEVAAFQADLELARYRNRVETGALTDEEKEDRKAILDFLGYDK